MQEGEVIKIDHGIIKRGEIICELKTGKFKVVAANAEHLTLDQDDDQAPHITIPIKGRESGKGPPQGRRIVSSMQMMPESIVRTTTEKA